MFLEKLLPYLQNTTQRLNAFRDRLSRAQDEIKSFSQGNSDAHKELVELKVEMARLRDELTREQASAEVLQKSLNGLLAEWVSWGLDLQKRREEKLHQVASSSQQIAGEKLGSKKRKREDEMPSKGAEAFESPYCLRSQKKKAKLQEIL